MTDAHNAENDRPAPTPGKLPDELGSRRDRKARQSSPEPPEGAVEGSEVAAAGRGKDVGSLLAAAHERDEQADARDSAASRRDMAASLRSFLGEETSTEHRAARRASALDRSASRTDRAASKADRASLIDDADTAEKLASGDLSATRRGVITYQLSSDELAEAATERLQAIGFNAATDGGTRVRITLERDEEGVVRRLLEQLDPGATAVV